ncbi:DNA-binding NarL/FixJ family response regulator [Streptomyces luteogriseus]|uniref:response regulator n=1 Tax=Streptomyces luteogriseus TaxID=68233 RepID=UPI00277FBE1C|nr:response regulator transcription factor [Streptomyces luteogriseus]MDQ0714919.1 DNA-binding NarL/FixJ family response regulator [Streptomyces luteogriseus]
MRQSLRIVIAEDAVLLREGLVHLLRRFGHQVLAAVGDGPALLAAAREHRPDLVITDVRMPPGQADEGLRTAHLLQSEQPRLAVLVLSQYVEQTFAEELLDDRRDSAGTGYLLKERIGDVEEFADAVTRVAAGATVVDPEVVRQLLARRRDPLDRLTPREREVLALMAEGRSNAAIARRLVVTEAAVAKHIASILMKLDLPPAAPDDHRRVLAVLAYLRA